MHLYKRVIMYIFTNMIVDVLVIWTESIAHCLGFHALMIRSVSTFYTKTNIKIKTWWLRMFWKVNEVSC